MSMSSGVLSKPPAWGPWHLAVFDLDGTLVDTRQDLMEALENAVGADRFDAASRERALAALHLGMHAMLIAALGKSAQNADSAPELYARYLSLYSTRIARHSRPYPQVVDTLRWLQGRGIQLAVCSNKPKDLSGRLLRSLGLKDFFQVIVGPECVGKAKPHPEPLYHAAWESGVSRARTVLIGDSRIDVQCANVAGIDCWLFTGGYDPAARAQAPHVFERFDQLCQPAYWEAGKRPAQRSAL